ncbi:MAG TPA: O-methyltransferase [Cyclobacteriaceae bacterium]
MNNLFFRTSSFISHKLHAVDEYSIHSPFLYNLFTICLKRPHHSDYLDKVEAIRKSYLKNQNIVEVSDLGTGLSDKRKIASVAKRSLSSKKFSIALNRIIDHLAYHNILELGTSLGINTLYMAENEQVSVITVEGSPNIAALAGKQFESLNKKNIHLIIANIDDALDDILIDHPAPELVYIDANHKYEPTTKYFNKILPYLDEQGIIIIDDIYWSKDMNNAWEKVRRHPDITMSADFFHFGILFKSKRFSNEYFILDY